MGKGKALSPAATGAGGGNDLPSSKGKKIEGSGIAQGGQKLDQLNHEMEHVSIHPAQETEWEVIGKKSRNRNDSTSAPRGRGHSDGLPRQGWNNTMRNNEYQVKDPRISVGRGSPKPQQSNRNGESAYMAPPPSIPPPLQHGWQWGSRVGSGSKGRTENENISSFEYDSGGDTAPKPDDGSDDDDDVLVEDSDDDLSDDYDSDASRQSYESRKKNKWFKEFFESLDKLTVEEINEQTRQWHCPACHNGPGAIDWYTGLQPLMAHAKTKGSTRVRLHRELAQLLDEELRRRGTSVIPAGEVFGKWKGLRETTTDHQIVWPPMVVVMNTVLEQGDNEKWIGMGNQELFEYFNTYAPVKARHSYGPLGHRGMSLLIFEATAMGYLEAERLHKHFAGEGTDRDAWDRRRVLFQPGGKRQLYGYLACKADVDTFNQHCQGKTRLKFDLRSYQEMVVIPMKQMSEDNQQLTWLKNKVVKQEQHKKALEETFGVVSQKLRETMEENRIVRLRTKIQHQENKEEMDFQEQFFKDQLEKVHKATEEKEIVYEKLYQEERAKVKQFVSSFATKNDRRLRKEEAARFIDSQVKGVEEFETEREKLIHTHEDKKVELKRKYLEEELKLEEEFDVALGELMTKYSPNTFEASSSTSPLDHLE